MMRHVALKAANEGGTVMTIRLGLAIVGLAVGIGGGALAQSDQDKAACRSDAIKLCSSAIGKEDEMKQCLAKNKDKLGPACKQVVEKRGG